MNSLSVYSILRRNVIANATVASLIKSRFTPGELATVSRPEYPCANFAFTGGTPDADYSAVGTPAFRIWSWARGQDGGYSKTHEIYEAIRAVLDNERFSDDDCYAVFKMMGEPIDSYDAISGVYGTMGTWRVRKISR